MNRDFLYLKDFMLAYSMANILQSCTRITYRGLGIKVAGSPPVEGTSPLYLLTNGIACQVDMGLQGH